jgi:acetyl-CoA carboxylase, biotin carboxylase subunit
MEMKRLLIANRGEIASRIIQTCNQLNIESVVVYSDADAELPYLKEATVAVRIGEAPAQKSYMDQTVILEAAKRTNAEAIHPGYGFLSENATFVKKVEQEGLLFIGPQAGVIALMGDKIKAREVMRKAGVPVVPGSVGPCRDPDEAVQVAEQIGYPVMLKASAGGGGIGMQKCFNKEEIIKAFQSNANRAKAYFGDASMFVEKAIENGRHIEIQIFADHFGNVVHLFERDCSVQRRHQKVIEESPSPFLNGTTRLKMTEAAIKAAKVVNYRSAGTVEFIVDEEGQFYFLEMNTRLQVEHPVTETIIGEDLVAWQLKVAEGEPLPKMQEDLKQTGHAVEFRLYAEDPQTFLPSPGILQTYVFPEMEDIRIDTGYAEGNKVTPFYDPMLAKIIAKGSTREEALRRAKVFFEATKIEGIKTNQALFLDLLKNSDFEKGNYTTALLKK